MNLEKLTWYVARSGGIVAWCVLALSLILGLVLSSRVLGKRVSPAWTLAAHRYLGGLAVIFTGIHVAAVMLDDFVDFGFVEVLVPFASSWRPGAVAWGIVGLYLLLAIELTSLAIRRLPKRLWRWVHWTSALLFVTATTHGFLAGSDVGRAFIVATVAVIVVLGALVAVRATKARAGTSGRAEPRVLLDQMAGKRAMRPEPPRHVLDSLTLASRPRAAPVHHASRERADAVDEFATFTTAAPPPRPKPPQHEPAFTTPAPPPRPKPPQHEPQRSEVSLGGMVAVKPRRTPPTAEAVSQPEWDRPSPPPPPPESVEEALPEVPWAMPAPDIGGPDRSPGRWRPADRPAASGSDGPDGPGGSPVASGSSDDGDARGAPDGGPEPSTADAHKSPDTPPFGGEAPKPPWAAPEANERPPGPTPRVEKRTSPRSGTAEPGPAPGRDAPEPGQGGP